MKQYKHETSGNRPVDMVAPLLDSANSRWIYFSSACRPFGMVNLSPDTIPGADWGGGYLYDNHFVHGFSHIHAWQLGAILVMPTTAKVDPSGGSILYGSNFDHAKETVTAGYHALHLNKHNIDIELTATARVGVHRYNFNQQAGQIIIDLATMLGPGEMGDAKISQLSPTKLEGFVVNKPTIRRPRPCSIYFAIELDQPAGTMQGWLNSESLGDREIVEGLDVRVILPLAEAASQTVMMKVAISYTSIDSAWNNLTTEASGWNFDNFRNEAADDWNNQLSHIKIEGGSEIDRRRFYTDLWHALLGRRTVSDVDGSYIDNTGPTPIVRNIPSDENGKPKYRHFNSDSFWGAQWSITPLWLLAWPEVVDEFCHCFLDYYRNGGMIPRGPAGGNYTFVMNSAQTTPLFAAAINSGIATFDTALAFEGLKKNHLPGGLMSKAGYEHDSCEGGGIEYYIERGYVPEGIETVSGFPPNGASQTLEHAYNDWALSQVAQTLDYKEDAETFAQRACNYKNLFDTSIGFMRQRTLDGSWLPDYSPEKRDGWCEGNGWMYTWYVPHDTKGLVKLFGSSDAFCDKLNEAFERSKFYMFCSPKDHHFVLPVDYGNQPSLSMAHQFIHADKPWLSQYWVRQILDAKRSTTLSPHEGYRGDEDQGMMGAVNALMAMGLFSITGAAGATPTYELTAPIFDKITINRPTGKPLTIETNNRQPDACYIQSAILNGKSHNKAVLTWDQIADNSHLLLELSTIPNKNWAI